MNVRLIVIMDPIAELNPSKDSSFAMLLAAKARNIACFYTTVDQVLLKNGQSQAKIQPVDVFDRAENFFSLREAQTHVFQAGDIVLMRKDPPVDAAFLTCTWCLDLAQKQGAQVVNDPRGLRDMNEKIYAMHFPEFTPDTLVSESTADLHAFVQAHKQCVIKPLDGMGGRGIFRANIDDDNLNSILSTVTHGGTTKAMLQTYLPAIVDGDKRVLLVDGKPMSHVLARIPSGRDFRGNLAAGGRGEVQPIVARDREIGEAVGKVMIEKGMRFVGIDIIGDHLTEINVTSPTCIREIHQATGIDIAGIFLDALLNN